MSLPSENFERWADSLLARLPVALNEALQELAGWARDEHSFTNRRGKTEASIEARITVVNAERVAGILSADLDAAVWLELARSGEWAFLLPVIMRHKEELLPIISSTLGKSEYGASGDPFAYTPNPALDAEYEAVKNASRKRS